METTSRRSNIWKGWMCKSASSCVGVRARLMDTSSDKALFRPDQSRNHLPCYVIPSSEKSQHTTQHNTTQRRTHSQRITSTNPCYHQQDGYESTLGIGSLCGKACACGASKEGAVLSMLARARLPFCCRFPTLAADKRVEVPNSHSEREWCSCHGRNSNEWLCLKNKQTKKNHSGDFTEQVNGGGETNAFGFFPVVCFQVVIGCLLSSLWRQPQSQLNSTTLESEKASALHLGLFTMFVALLLISKRMHRQHVTSAAGPLDLICSHFYQCLRSHRVTAAFQKLVRLTEAASHRFSPIRPNRPTSCTRCAVNLADAAIQRACAKQDQHKNIGS